MVSKYSFSQQISIRLKSKDIKSLQPKCNLIGRLPWEKIKLFNFMMTGYKIIINPIRKYYYPNIPTVYIIIVR